jgi:arylsulfatase
MPTLERMAANGLKYNRFHTTALCSPTRDRAAHRYNHHSNNAGAIMEVATAFPGNTGVPPQTITPLAQVLRMNGYSTAAFGSTTRRRPGKVVSRVVTTVGRRARDSTSSTASSGRNQPSGTDGLRRDDARVLRASAGYHFTTDMTDSGAGLESRRSSRSRPYKPVLRLLRAGATTRRIHGPGVYRRSTRASSRKAGTR